VQAQGEWFRAPGQSAVVSLRRRAAFRRLLAALCAARVHTPGRALDVGELREAGWPGEQVRVEAGANRVYVAIATLRRMGLDGTLLNVGDGYLLSRDVPVVVAP
jgi:hypothetical protein